MKNAVAIFWKGLATLLPLTVTIWVLYAAFSTLDRLLSQMVPAHLYFPGSGLLVGIVITVGFGALMHFFLFERLIDYGSSVLNRIPVVKSFYSAMQDFMAYFGRRSASELSRVVLVTLSDDCQLIGFVTNPNFDTPLQERGPIGQRIAVYLPMSYQIGGFMVLLPAERVVPLEISVEDAMRLVLTAGVRSA